jgi:hypothetical protein
MIQDFKLKGSSQEGPANDQEAAEMEALDQKQEVEDKNKFNISKLNLKQNRTTVKKSKK